MKIKYEFVTGETVEVEVTGELEQVMIEMEDEEKQIERRETRRHESLREEKESSWLISKDLSTEDIAINDEYSEKFMNKARSVLTVKQMDAFRKICITGITEAEYADAAGIAQPVVHRRIDAAKNKIKKFLK